MCLRFLSWFTLLFLLVAGMMMLSGCTTSDPTVSAETRHYIPSPKQKKIPVSMTAFRVCADPNNLPFTNKKGEGFENKIAELIARELHQPLEYTWFAQRRGFFRNTLREGVCDAVIGAPERTERALSSEPYYYSSYVFVTRKDSNFDIVSLDDPLLRQLKVGVEIIGDDGNNPPPAQSLADRGIFNNVVGYSVYGDYSQPNPPARIIDAVVNKDVAVAIVWGPRAGYFAGKERVPLEVVPVDPEENAKLPYVFGISIGVRYGEDEFKEKLNSILSDRRVEIEKILSKYHVPLVTKPEHQLDLEVGE